MEAVLEKQRQALALTIKEANKKETQRIKRLSTVRNVIEQQSLLSRYDKERAFDREYIERLSTDFFTLQQRAQNNDEMMKFVEKRKEIQHSQPVKSHGPAELLPNRFAGLEDYDGILFHTDIVKKFDRHDQRFESKTNRAPYNPATEVKKMRLLQEKKNLLTKLITVQQQESKATMPASQYIAQRRTSFGDNYSVASGSTGVSYATFGSSGAHSSSQPSRRSGPPVPRLNLSR